MQRREPRQRVPPGTWGRRSSGGSNGLEVKAGKSKGKRMAEWSEPQTARRVPRLRPQLRHPLAGPLGKPAHHLSLGCLVWKQRLPAPTG